MKRIIYFGGTTCHACKVLRPQIEAVCARHGFADLTCINAEEDECEELERYIDTLRSVPTLILEQDGKEVARCTDNMDAPNIVAQWISTTERNA